MSKKKNPESLDQLLLDFEDCHKVVTAAADKLGQAANAIASLRGNSTQPEEANGPPSNKALRATVNRLAGVLSIQNGLDYSTVWVMAYHGLYERTKFHAVVESKGKGTYLDAVAREGYLPILQEVMIGMLTDPRYNGVRSS